MTNYQGYWSNAKLKQYAPAHLDFFAIKHGKRYKHGVNTMKYLTSTSAYYQLYETTIATYHMLNQVIVLNSGGHRTATTKNRMNHLLSKYGIPYYIYQHKWKWFLCLVHPTDTCVALFHDGITLSKDGILTAPSIAEQNKHKIRMLGKYITKALITYSVDRWLHPKEEHIQPMDWSIPKIEGALASLGKCAEADSSSNFPDMLVANMLHWLERDDLLDNYIYSYHEIEELAHDNIGDWIIAGLEDKL